MSLSNYAETLALNFLFNTQTATRPTSWYIALHTADPTDTGTVGEVSTSGTAYARQAITFGAASGTTPTQSLNTNTVTYAAATGSGFGIVTYCSIWDAASGGNCIATGALGSSATVSAGTTYSFPIGTVTASLD